ncbi:GspE/PulE family protein [Vibrio sp. SCSIO 43137]|uniref:GspE/PulE family protein n=1 Tax=Vibrio sp. SCSIO 43137 TaxID=3021011 RepID=UPI002307B51D|nr:ATPase, T2SS/T4P/T4SS family [Vibrio sp. SCSIO 43137]WCE29230.1 ATPase, T2SS/T4P/T4SS family [Vibrio sp. SCSIO 43137]
MTEKTPDLVLSANMLNSDPVSQYLLKIVMDAVSDGASDIHFEPYQHCYRIRVRCDGILINRETPPTHFTRRFASLIKVLAKMDISESRLPQDGHVQLQLSHDSTLDMRVSTLPCQWGEKLVLRLQDKKASAFSVNELGFNRQQQKLFLKAIKHSQGMVIITGPTGSGKTATLYTALDILNREELNICTAENPVEIDISGINQVEVNEKTGLSFSLALKSFLRQDPDIIMLGEIRDNETAAIAIKSAQTGHLLLTTLHSNSTVEALGRLSNMGISSFNLLESLILVIAQRLVRRLCPSCKTTSSLSEQQSQALGFKSDKAIFRANASGCEQCKAGYKGRIGLFEMLWLDQELKSAIRQNIPPSQLCAIAQQQGMQTLKESAFYLIADGLTSLDEIQRVIDIEEC